MKNEIERISQKPLNRKRAKASFIEDDLPVYALKPDKKQIRDLYSAYDEINVDVDTMREMAQKSLQNHQNELWRKVDTHFKVFKNELIEEEKFLHKDDDDRNIKERIKSLKEQLEVMTNLAQELDLTNRQLKEEEQQVRIEYSSQEKDSALLIKQILFYKKQQKICSVSKN